MSAGGEAAWLAAVVRGLGSSVRGAGVELGIGDDAAVLAPPAEGRLLATVDMLVEGQHFLRRGPLASQLRDIGWRALAVNLSDVAAMGGRPHWVLSSLGVPDDMTAADVEELCSGLAEAAAAFEVAVAGGNLARTPERLVVDIAVLGSAARPVTRSGAEPGDHICVTGRLGAASAGLAMLRAGDGVRARMGAASRMLVAAQRRPEPRVREGWALGTLAAGTVHAMCDVSDGLTLDLGRLCGPDVGAVVWREALPVPEEVGAAATVLGLAGGGLDFALHGGEDYELLCAVAPGALDVAARAVAAAGGVALHPIGRFQAVPGLRLAVRPGAAEEPVASAGWDPFASWATKRQGTGAPPPV